MSWGGSQRTSARHGADAATRAQLDRIRRRQQGSYQPSGLRSATQTPFASFGQQDEFGWQTPGAHLYPMDEQHPEAYQEGWAPQGRRTLDGFSPYPDMDDEYQHRSPMDALPRDLRLDRDPSWGRGGAEWYGGYGLEGPRYYSDLPRHYADDGDSMAARAKWREEVLNRDPDKAPDNVAETSTLVISFITRGPTTHPHGQGDELLFFRPRRKDPTKIQHQQDMRAPWTFLCIDASPILPAGSTEKVPTSEELSKDSITKVLPHIDPASDLRLIRRSKPLRWDDTTMLESFLYRLPENKEDLESEEYKDLEFKLGHGMHYWTQLSGFHGAIESDVVSTAMIAVCLPTALSLGIDNIFSDTTSRSEHLAAAALDVLYLCVQAGYARDAFRHYPIPPPITGKGELDVVVKRRMWAYWTEVAAWHLCRIRPAAEVSITYSLTKAVSAVKEAIDDPKTSIDDVEKLLVNSIAFEADRARNAGRQLIREGVAEILYNSAFGPDVPAGDPALESLHLFTTSSASVCYGVLAKLITHVLSRKGSPGPGNSATRRIWDLKITIAESRPLHEGVALAMGLTEVITSYAKYKEKTAEINRRTSEPPGIGDLGPSALDNGLQAKLRELLGGTLSPLRHLKDAASSAMSPGRQNQALGLAHLLAELDSKKEVREPKVTIEVITDSALPSTIMASGRAGKKPIILLGAERVLANGDIINKMGSSQAAWAGKSFGGSVLCLTRSDRIHPTNITPPAPPANPGAELVGAWKLTLGADAIDGFVESPQVAISNPTFDETSHEWITGYVTDLGLMGGEMLTEFAKVQAEMAAAVGLT